MNIFTDEQKKALKELEFTISWDLTTEVAYRLDYDSNYYVVICPDTKPYLVESSREIEVALGSY